MRFQLRHVQQTLADHVEAQLDVLGWVNDPVNFGTDPITFVNVRPQLAGQEILPNTVVVTIGDTSPSSEYEMGGGLWEATYDFMVDVYGATPGISVSIASDVYDVLTDLTMQVTDYTSDPPVPSDVQMETDFVEIISPTAALTRAEEFKRDWRVVAGVLDVRYQRAVA